MTNSFAVNTQAEQYLQQFRRKPAFCINTGTVDIYLGDDPTVTVGRGIPLKPGFGISWDEDVPMWACTGSGVGTIVVTHLRGNICNVYDLT